MNLIIIIALIIILIIVLSIVYITNYNNIQCYIIRINEAENNIDSILRQRFDLLNKAVDVIKANINTDEEVLGTIVKLRSKKLSNFELDRKLYEAIKEFNSYKEKYPELKQSEVFTHADVSINESEAEIIAFRKYYNDIITDYNRLVKTFPSNIVALFCHFKEKPYFDENTTSKIKL